MGAGHLELSARWSEFPCDALHYRMNCEQGEARGGERPSSLQRGMRPFRRATTHLEFRTVDDVEGRMETYSSLTKTFEWIVFTKSIHSDFLFRNMLSAFLCLWSVKLCISSIRIRDISTAIFDPVLDVNK